MAAAGAADVLKKEEEQLRSVMKRNALRACDGAVKAYVDCTKGASCGAAAARRAFSALCCARARARALAREPAKGIVGRAAAANDDDANAPTAARPPSIRACASAPPDARAAGSRAANFLSVVWTCRPALRAMNECLHLETTDAKLEELKADYARRRGQEGLEQG